MDLNSNFRKRRLLEDTVSSSNSPLPKRDATTSTANIRPMTLDMYTQTEWSREDVIRSGNLENQMNLIFQTLSKHEAILKDIRDVVDGNNQNTTRNIQCEMVPRENINYKIIANGDDAITIEPIKLDHDEEPSNELTYVEQHYQITAKPESETLNDSSNATNITQTVYRFDTNNQVLQESKQEHNNSRNVLAESSSPTQNTRRFPLVDLKPDGYTSNDEIEMIAIGPNGTLVPKAILETMKWDSASSATRKLLTVIFQRETLATHSLTGRPSPAFHGREKPSKDQLDPGKVIDIIHMVTKFCNVPEREVRNAITTKCADENKMLNQRNRKERNKENFRHSTQM